MKQKASKYFGIVLLGILLFFSANGILGKVVFGFGLGDMFYLPVLWGITIIYLIAFFVGRKKSNRLFKTNLLLALPSLWIILSATLWRGVEYPWNGEIFYIPCRTEIQIESQAKNRKEVLTMCSMTYYSEFTGIWNGKEIENINGEIKIPKKLEKYLDFPIEKIHIQPAHVSQIVQGKERKVYRFNLDTLKINEGYRLGGEIYKIIDRKPMIQARIK